MPEKKISQDLHPDHILIVDDVDRNIQLLAEILISNGYNISPANSGEEALDALKIKPYPDLILLDIMMPGLSGIDVCKIIKADPEKREIPVIFLTAKAETESIVEGFKSGASDYLTKPFKAEELLARVRVQLENIHLRREVLAVNKSLEANVAAREQLLSIIAHDLKSPLGSLLGLSQLYAEGGKFSDLESLSEFAKVANNSIKNILDLLSNLLSWARLQSGHMKLNPVRIDFIQLLGNIINLLKTTAEQKEISINVMSSNPVFVQADMNMIETVFRNLISNAIKFTNTGGKVEINFLSKGDEVEISVRDNGVGMSPQIIGDLFKVDVRHQSQGTRKEKGTGLGLVLCKDMVEKNNGTIRAESTQGSGSVFYVTLKAS